MRPTVLLFDIDGTLVSTGGAGRRAIARAFAMVHTRPDAVTFRLDGMTDRLIVRRGLDAIGVEPTAAAIDEVLSAYLSILSDEIRQVPEASYVVHPGIREAIVAAQTRGAAVGLGTGNVREGARVKLERAALYQHFGFGGFGCDAEVRLDLIRLGAERGAQALGLPLSACRVVIIGDTPHDVSAAQGIGAECLGVGTGYYSAKQLLECGATFAFDDLKSDGAIDALLG
ncbi:MAG TPA: HAD family hydrolase [Polyangiaceae bacterium]|nr:HAD family hydrolase [Polyangiaceae bacterium]